MDVQLMGQAVDYIVRPRVNRGDKSLSALPAAGSRQQELLRQTAAAASAAAGRYGHLTSVALHDVPGASGAGRIEPCITGPLTWPV